MGQNGSQVKPKVEAFINSPENYERRYRAQAARRMTTLIKEFMKIAYEIKFKRAITYY
jgi:AraC-like DNA-binding protein